MFRTFVAFVLFAFALQFAAAQNPAPLNPAATQANAPQAPDPSQLVEADRNFSNATRTRGLEGWMEYMAPNAVLLRDQPQVGPKSIRASLEKSFAAPGFQITWNPTKGEFVGNSFDLGFTVGRYEVVTVSNGGKPNVEHGSYLTTWLKQKDGSWKVVSDIGSPDPSSHPGAPRVAPQRKKQP